MSSAAFLVICGKDGWSVAASGRDGCEVRQLTATDGKDPADAAAEAAAALKQLGHREEGVCLALPSEMVLAAPIDCAGLPRRNRRTAMVYRLEEQLPLEAERLTADFLPPSGGRALGVAAETDKVRQIIDALAVAGVETSAVCPAALLALWQACAAGAAEADYAVVCWGAEVDLFRLTNGRPAAWYTAASDETDDLARCLQADMLQSPVGADTPRVLVFGELSESDAESIAQTTAPEPVQSGEESPPTLAAGAARALLAGKDAGWVNLRRDNLAVPNPWRQVAGPAKCAAALLAMLLAALAGMGYWRAARYEALAGEFAGRQEAIYGGLYPNTAVPPNVKSRLASQWKRLSGVSGAGCEIPRRRDALGTLRSLTGNLPPSVRLRIEKVRIDPHSIQVEGRTRTHSDAERIAEALAQGGLRVGAPRSEYLNSGGVAFRLTAALADEKAAPRSARTGG